MPNKQRVFRKLLMALLLPKPAARFGHHTISALEMLGSGEKDEDGGRRKQWQ